jgi:serine/threonine-protein kinase
VPIRSSGPIASGATVDLGWGRVVVGPVIGDGGMGTVYRAWLYYNPQGPRAGTPPHEVAVKVLHAVLSGRPHVRRLFLGEAEALARLSHPNIVQFQALVEGDQLGLVLEFVDGEALDQVITRHVSRARPGGLPAMPFLRAWHYFQQLLGALAATHELGIVHRDVKPANLLIRRDGLAKLGDFGIARLPADAARSSGGMQPGTGAYMSPEQVMGQSLDGRSDLYGAAIVLYEMLSGRTPFDNGSRTELLVRAAQCDEYPPPLTQFVPQAPPVIDMLFARALAKDPAHRFPNAIELGNAFRHAIAIPDTSGWQAQQELARGAAGIAGPLRGKGGTAKVPQYDADRMRAAVAGAYRSALHPTGARATVSAPRCASPCVRVSFVPRPSVRTRSSRASCRLSPPSLRASRRPIRVRRWSWARPLPRRRPPLRPRRRRRLPAPRPAAP